MIKKYKKIHLNQKGGAHENLQEYITTLHDTHLINDQVYLLLKDDINLGNISLMPEISLEHFIRYVLNEYEINLPSVPYKPPKPTRRPPPVPVARPHFEVPVARPHFEVPVARPHFEVPVARPHFEVPAARPLLEQNEPWENRNTNIIKVLITGLNDLYHNPENNRKIRLFILNIVDTIRSAGKEVLFFYYDNFTHGEPHYYINEITKNKFLTRGEMKLLENRNDILLVDLAHLIHYYKPAQSYFESKRKVYQVLINTYNGEVATERIPSNPEILLLNVFYPGYIKDMTNDEFIRNFKFFRIRTDGSIETFIEKAHSKNYKIRDGPDFVLNFDVPIGNQFLITGLMSNY
jgi:hypothetical protein